MTGFCDLGPRLRGGAGGLQKLHLSVPDLAGLQSKHKLTPVAAVTLQGCAMDDDQVWEGGGKNSP